MDPAARRALLVNRHHLHRTGGSVQEVVGDLVGLHTADPLTPHLALWARLPNFVPADLDAALHAQSVWRLHAMRRTLWIVRTDEAGMFQRDAGAAVHRKERDRVLKWVAQFADDPEVWVEETGDAVLAALAQLGTAASRDLSAAVPAMNEEFVSGAGKWAGTQKIGSRLLFLLAMDLRLFRLPSSSWVSSQYRWTTPPEPGDGTSLLRRYLARFGPVSMTDLRWWTRWTKGKTLEHLPPDVVEEDGLFRLPETVAVEPDPGVAFLPSLDPTPMGYKERGWFLGPHGPDLFDRNGNIGPTVWVDGRIVGGWASVDDGVRYECLQDVGADRRIALDEEAHRLSGWLDRRVRWRWRTPLERRLAP